MTEPSKELQARMMPVLEDSISVPYTPGMQLPKVNVYGSSDRPAKLAALADMLNAMTPEQQQEYFDLNGTDIDALVESIEL